MVNGSAFADPECSRAAQAYDATCVRRRSPAVPSRGRGQGYRLYDNLHQPVLDPLALVRMKATRRRPRTFHRLQEFRGYGRPLAGLPINRKISATPVIADELPRRPSVSLAATSM